MSETRQDAVERLGKLTSDDFNDIRNVTIFRALKSMEQEGKPLDSVSVYMWLSDHNKLLDAGDTAYVQSLPEATPSPENFDHYQKRLTERADERAFIRDMIQMIAVYNDPSVPRSSLGEVLERMRLAIVERCNRPTEFVTLMLEREFNGEVEPRPLEPVLTLGTVPISTAGNITTVTSGVKTGKTAVIGAMNASIMPHDDRADLLGFNSSNPDNLAVLWFDSEQSKYDFWTGVSRAAHRAGLEKPPPWLRAFNLAGLSWDQS